MAKNRQSEAGGAGLTSHQGEDGSFEIVMGDEPVSHTPERPSAPRAGGGLRWIAVIGVCAVLVVGGVSLAANLGADDEEEEEESVTSNEPAFRPYAGGGVGGGGDEAAQGAPAVSDERQPVRDRQQRRGAQDEDVTERELLRVEARGRRHQPVPEEGRELVEDRHGQEMGRWEADERLRRELESVENVDEDFQRRLRRRDIERHSRVLRPDGQGRQLQPAIEVSEDVQRRIQAQFSREEGEHLRDESSVGEEGYRRDDFYHDDDEYYDEYYDDYDDDEYYDDYDDY